MGWRGEDGDEEVDGGEELPQLDAHLAHVLQVVLGLMTLDHIDRGGKCMSQSD